VEKKIVENSGKRVWLWVELKKKFKKKIVTKKNSGKKIVENSGKRGWLRALTHDL